MDGKIKTLRKDRGFGFIDRGSEAGDLFFHAKEVSGVTFDELNEGDVLSFEVAQGQKGLNAVGVTRVSQA